MTLPALTSLRFFAALAVFVSHLGFLYDSPWAGVNWFYERIGSQGYIGVTFFFVLSGFILSHANGPRLRAGTLHLRSYFAGRIARIYPLHLIAFVASLPIALYGMRSLAEVAAILPEALSNILLVQAFVQGGARLFNSPAWSLSVEMFFYLLFPFLLAMRTSLLVVLLAAVTLFHWAVIRFVSDGATITYLLYVFPPARVGDFVAGMLACRLYSRFPALPPALATGLQALSLVSLVLCFAAKRGGYTAWCFDLYYLAPMTAIVLSFAWSEGCFARWLSGRTMVFLGQASFALYLVHFLVIFYGEYLRRMVLGLNDPLTELLFCAAYLALSLALAALLHVALEERLRQRVLRVLQRLRLTDRPRPQALSAAAASIH